VQRSARDAIGRWDVSVVEPVTMIDDDYGTVLQPGWPDLVVRDRHPRDRSRVYTVGGLAAPVRPKGLGTVVLLHGVGNSGAVWAPVLPPIASLAEQFRLGPVVAPTVSPALLTGDPDDRTDAVTLLVDFLAEVAAPPWRIVGHSMGGVLAGLILRARPEMVRQAVLVNAPLPGVTRRLKRRDTLDRTGRAVLALKALSQITAFGRPRLPGFLRGPELVIVRNALRGFVHDPYALDAEVISRAILSSRTVDGVDFLRLSRQLPDWEAEPFTAKPVTIVLGDRDPLVPPSDLDAVRARYPDSLVHVLPACGHFAHLERADSTVGAIAEAFTRRT
jgi:pimeloyl-ACP methyl ester carboxylesterase